MKISDERWDEIKAETQTHVAHWNAHAKEHGCCEMGPVSWHDAMRHLIEDLPYGAEERMNWSDEYAEVVKQIHETEGVDPAELDDLIIMLQRLRQDVAELEEEEQSLERLRRWHRELAARDVFGATTRG